MSSQCVGLSFDFGGSEVEALAPSAALGAGVGNSPNEAWNRGLLAAVQAAGDLAAGKKRGGRALSKALGRHWCHGLTLRVSEGS